MPSQNDEDIVIRDYFSGVPPARFLDIGAYDGKTFSNTHALAGQGWQGVCVEASPQCFVQLQKLYRGSDQVQIICAAVGTENGLAKLYDSGGAVASLSREHMRKWQEAQKDYMAIWVPVITPAYLVAKFGEFDFVSIDTEGTSAEVLRAMPLDGVRLVCVEVDGPAQLSLIEETVALWSMHLVARTEENVLYGL